MSEKKEEAKAGTPPEATGEEKPAANKKKLIIMAGAGLLVVLIGAGGAFFFLNKGNKTAAAHSSPETAEAPAGDHGEAKKDDHGEAKKDDHGEAKKDDHGEGKKDDKKDAKGNAKSEPSTNYGQIYPLKPFHMNLGNPLENRYLRLEISFDYRGGDPQKSELDARSPQIRDIIVNTASRKTMEFILGPDGKDQLRYEIFTKLNQILDKKIEAVYITDILVE
jgi:flagellar FliL protein